MELFFYTSFGLLAYVYIGYPILVFGISHIICRSVKKKPIKSHVSLIISAYNEESVIEIKLQNSLALEYPKELLEIIVVSDGSTDRTDDIVRGFGINAIRLLRIDNRRGKTFCQNEAVKFARGGIIVFSDADSMYDKRAIQELVANFSDPNVGVVCGELRYIKGSDVGEGMYWNIETFLKRAESTIDSCLGVNGAIYALRKKDYVDLPSHGVSDFIEPFLIYAKKLRVVYDATAFCTEKAVEHEDEFERKIRIVTGGLESLSIIRTFLNPFKYGWYSFTLWSHKVIRWFTFVLLITIFISNLFLLSNQIYRVILAMQIICYTFAIIGKFTHVKVFSIPYYFAMLQVASLSAFIRVLRGKTATTWETVRK